MPINLGIPKEFSDLKPRITVVGVGGAGGNAVNNMIRVNLVGCEFVACNTDAQALQHSLADRRIQLGQGLTQGLGAGSRPEVGRAAAEEVIDEIMQHLQGSHMVFITAGMGGGTGTGAAPVIAKAAREAGILTVGVVTKPFHFEGTHRMRLAESGIEELTKFVDTLLIIPNQNLFRVANERTTFADAFKMADDVLHSGVRGVTDLMVMPGLINLDFADIRAVMGEMGKAMMGTGEAYGEKRALDAAEAAISNPLLDDVSMKGARGVLINITGGADMTLFEVDEAANRIREEVDPEANIIFGSTFDEKLEGGIRISVVATGIDAEVSAMARAAADRAAAERLQQPPQLTVVAGGQDQRANLASGTQASGMTGGGMTGGGMTGGVAPGNAGHGNGAQPSIASLINVRPGGTGIGHAVEPVRMAMGVPSAVAVNAQAGIQANNQSSAALGTASSDPVETASEPRPTPQVHNGSFIAPEPVAAGRGSLGRAESETYGALRSGTQLPPAGRPQAPARTLLQRIIGAGRSPAQTGAQNGVQNGVQNGPHTGLHGGHAPGSKPVLPAAAQSSGALAPPLNSAAARAVAAAGGGHLRAEPTLAPAGGEDGYLDIPAFLRRQAN